MLNKTSEEFFQTFEELNKSVCNGFQIIAYTPAVKSLLKGLLQKDKHATLMFHEKPSDKAPDGVMGVLTCIWKIRGSVRCGAIFFEVHKKHLKDFQTPADYELEFVSQERVNK